ncbi:MAG: tetratricopeptide repeat protein [Acetobacteraceae bacterium]|nr:tetratricopeptide repeat protein [Acetobacteraceae bacterium]
MQQASVLRPVAGFVFILGALCGVARATPTAAKHGGRPAINGAFGAYLDGHFALSQSDPEQAADEFIRVLATDPGDAELIQEAFVACLLSGRPEAARLAKELPDNQAAQLLLADLDAKTGSWDAAEQRFRALPKQGFTQVLQPLLVAWAQQGAGHTDAALATLRPYVEGQRLRGVYALHAAMIADIAGRNADAARLYRVAQAEYGGANVRLAQVLASWQARQGHLAEAQQTLRALAEGGDEMAIAVPAMMASVAPRPVARATDGIAEAYIAMAAALRQQDATEFSSLLLRLALGLRPDFTAVRILISDIESGNGQLESAIRALAPVGTSDPLIGVVRLRRADLTERLGKTEEATRELEQLARDYPDSPLPLEHLGDILRSKNRFPEAVTAYDRALARLKAPRRSAWPLFYARGIAEERAHDWPHAQADLERALQLAPDQPYVLNYLGYSWADQGQNLEQARQMLTHAVELRPNDGSIVDSLGWVLLRQGDTKGAVQSLERAVEMMPEDPTINGHLGDAYWAIGRHLEAEYQWRRALILHPDPDEAAKLEVKLHDYANQADGPATAEHRVQ